MSSRQGKNQRSILEVDLLLAAYASGYFPMADSRYGTIRWYSPDPRAIILLDAFKVSRSLKQTIKKKIFDVRLNTAFEAVIRNCAARRETWISEEIVQSYLELHRFGSAHSVEAWHKDTLAGGLYGVALGAAFFGESMFSRKRDASKVALVFLVERLHKRGFELLDTQYMTPHLAHFGAVNISREDYLSRLKRAIEKQTSFTD
jgi:leucyl/phenylalanyl-tRNA--protein transferase